LITEAALVALERGMPATGRIGVDRLLRVLSDRSISAFPLPRPDTAGDAS
jgi:lysyl-tRNA synthetase class II